MKHANSLTTPSQLKLLLKVEKEVEIDGVGMGVLSDGTPYLTGRGLARMCGVFQNAITELQTGWNEPPIKPREQKIKNILSQQGLVFEYPYIPIDVDGVTHYAYPDALCMAVLEYYAFEAGNNIKEQAKTNYRLLARKTFREFIYTQVGYDPRNAIPEIWRQFHDRVALVYDSVPHGYFSIFKEVADIVVTLIRGGAPIGPGFVPDISIGIHWSNHWKSQNMAAQFGERRKYQHNYPGYFPQAESNPQTPYCYPDSALAEFRRWMRESYLPDKFPEYLKGKERQGVLPPSFSQLALTAIESRG